MSAIPESIIPKRSKKSLKSKYTGNVDAWRKFASRIQKNPTVRAFILDRDKSCRACGGLINSSNELHVHHSDYDHVCGFNHTIAVRFESRIRDLPDCGRCQSERPELFNECMSRLAALHPFCNYRVEKMAERYQSRVDSNKNDMVVPDKLTPYGSLSKGMVLRWVEKIKSPNSGHRRRNHKRDIIDTQELTACIEFIEDNEYLVLKILTSRVIEKFSENAIPTYHPGEIVRMQAKTLFERRQGKIGDIAET